MKNVFVCGLLAFLAVKALAAESSTEEEYVPIPELNVQQPKAPSGASSFDDIRLHAGAAFINSYQNVPLGAGQRVQGGLRGAQFNFGMDIFSQHWILQGVLFTLPQATISQAQIGTNGFELRPVYETNIAEQVTFHGGLGIESRNYSIHSSYGDNSMSSGAWVIASGIDYWPAEFISAGVELAGHLPLANSDDPSSVDIGVRLGGHF